MTLSKKLQFESIDSYKIKKNHFFDVELNSSLQLSDSENQLIQYQSYKTVKEIDFTQLKELIAVFTANSLRAMSSNMEAKDIVLLINDLTNEVIQYFKFLTIKEVEKIMYDGIRNNFNTNTIGLSIVNFNLWAKKYISIRNQKNLELKRKLEASRKLIEIPNKKLSSEDLINIIKADFIHIKKIFSQLKNRENISFDNYWLNNGLFASSSFLAPRLIEFKLISEKQIESELKSISFLNSNKESIKSISDVLINSMRKEAERIVCCKLAIKLRDKKIKDGEKKTNN